MSAWRAAFPTLLLAVSSAFAQGQATSFTARADGYQIIGGVLTPATADFRIFVRSDSVLAFDLTPHLPAGAVLNEVTLSQCQAFCNGEPIHFLCGFGAGHPRPACSQTGYVNNNGGEVVASDILPYGQFSSVSRVLDLLRHRLVYITLAFTLPGDTARTRIRGNLVPE